VDEKRRRVTVMFASLDSASEIKNYPFFVKKFHEISEKK